MKRNAIRRRAQQIKSLSRRRFLTGLPTLASLPLLSGFAFVSHETETDIPVLEKILPKSAAIPAKLDEIEAVILYPCLTVPQILPAGVDECSIVVVTDAAGKAVLSDPAKASPYVNRHLRLMGLEDDKTAQTAVKSAKLYTGMPETFADTDEGRADAQQFLEARVLDYDPNGALRVPGQKGAGEGAGEGALGTIIGRIAPEALELYGSAFSAFFEIRLKKVKELAGAWGLGETPKSWAWIVTTDEQKHLAAEKKKAEGDRNFFLKGQVHQPLDRLLDAELRDRRHVRTPDGYLLSTDNLFEAPVTEETYPNPAQGAEHARLQAWHPVVMRADTALQFGHLTDVHINVRQASLAESPVKVLENCEASEGKAFAAVGPRVAHSYRSFKSLIDKVKEAEANALMLTGDYIDFNHNIDPAEIKKTGGNIAVSADAAERDGCRVPHNEGLSLGGIRQETMIKWHDNKTKYHRASLRLASAC